MRTKGVIPMLVTLVSAALEPLAVMLPTASDTRRCLSVVHPTGQNQEISQ